MRERISVGPSAAEYFKELVESSLARGGLVIDPLTSFYIVGLLARFAEHPWSEGDDRPLALQLGDALAAEGGAARARLRHVGDQSLFISGYFSDSLNRRPVDVDYYIALGELAYNSLSQRESRAPAAVFHELAEKFVEVVDLLAEVSEKASSTPNTDALRVYERWLRTGSVRDGRLLVERGIVPNASIGHRFIQ